MAGHWQGFGQYLQVWLTQIRRHGFSGLGPQYTPKHKKTDTDTV